MLSLNHLINAKYYTRYLDGFIEYVANFQAVDAKNRPIFVWRNFPPTLSRFCHVDIYKKQ